MPLDESVSLDSIADNAVGFVGSDLKAVCQKAAYSALWRQVPTIDSSNSRNNDGRQADFLQALKEVKPAVLRSVEVESPHVAWDNIGGLEQIKQTLQESVEGALLHPQLYTQTKAQAPKGILLWPLEREKPYWPKAVASQVPS
jgi:transitional endoplasmic reticulum ATPase